MSAAGGTADFFYRESQRLGYVARSALKVRTRALPVPISSRLMPLTRCVAAAADPDAEAAQAHHPGRRRARPRLRPRRVASGDDPFTLPCLLSCLSACDQSSFPDAIDLPGGCCVQVACQNLGPLEKGGVVVGIDVKVSGG